MPLKAVILARAVNAVTSWGWIETWFLNSWIIKLSELTDHCPQVTYFSAPHTGHTTVSTGSLPHTVQGMFSSSVAPYLKGEKSKHL